MKSLLIAMLDPELFGRIFGAPTFAAWSTVAKARDGLPLDATELGNGIGNVPLRHRNLAQSPVLITTLPANCLFALRKCMQV